MDSVTESPVLTAGADICKGKWAVVFLSEGRFHSALLAEKLTDVLQQVEGLAFLAVDVPIGLADGGDDWPRAADTEAKSFLGKARSSVFLTPPRPILDCTEYSTANARHRELTEKGLSQQSWALSHAIREADAAAASDDRVIEVHPEVCFREMAGKPLVGSKKTWSGSNQRRSLLIGQGIEIPNLLSDDAGRIPPDDLLDAAAAAWTAHRFLTDEVKSLGVPTPDGMPNRHAGRIWY